MSNPGAMLIFGLLFVLVGLGMGYWAYSEYQLGQQSSAWPIVMGTITQSDVLRFRQTAGKHRGVRYRPEIDYVYVVNGQEYRGSQIAIGGATVFHGAPDAEAVANKYPMGATIPVAYDPAHPGQRAVLEPGPANALGTLSLMGGMGAVFVLLGGWLALRRGR